VAADFNGDGKLDLAVADSGVSEGSDLGSIAILIGNGDGSFQTPSRYSAGTSRFRSPPPISTAMASSTWR
jgi:hypothetical protein